MTLVQVYDNSDTVCLPVLAMSDGLQYCYGEHQSGYMLTAAKREDD